ncbi:hypothetical protein A9Q99_04210 [Gammaproteobacteria bacterium 45_16_T64]|nr:hypothetical protein A9Q99_04210 [Gammaproteobacteria bacterium 45_16_T64]
MIDTHCHLDFPAFDIDRSETLSKLHQLNVTDVVVPGVLESDWPRVSTLCGGVQRVSLHPAYGLHPCFMEHHKKPQDVAVSLGNYIEEKSPVAVGEIGLDYFSCSASKAEQLMLFDTQLNIAKVLELPVLLHVRKAHDDVLHRLRKIKLSKGGVVHAFSGSEQQAQQYVALGFVLGMGGSVTYDRAKKLHRIIRELPLSSFVLETDAPDIPPAFIARGERNSPVNLPKIAQAIAEVKGVSLDELDQVTTVTAKRILSL